MTDQPTTAAELDEFERRIRDDLSDFISRREFAYNRWGHAVRLGDLVHWLDRLSLIRDDMRLFAIEREAAAAALPSVERLAEALHAANIDCDYSRKFDRKSCAPGDGPHAIAAAAILAALAETPR